MRLGPWLLLPTYCSEQLDQTRFLNVYVLPHYTNDIAASDISSNLMPHRFDSHSPHLPCSKVTRYIDREDAIACCGLISLKVSGSICLCLVIP